MTAPRQPLSFGRGAYAALQRQARDCPNAGELPSGMVKDWYAGFDEARRRMALLEGELVRGESSS